MKFGIVGLGSIGHRHALNLLEMGHRVVGLDLKPNREIEAYPIMATLEDFWQEKLDAVLVCTPPESHCTFATQALQHGCHVFIEKPVTERSGSAEWIRTTAMVEKRLVAVGYQLRWNIAPHFVRWKPHRDLLITLRCDMATWPSRYAKDPLLECSHEIDAAVFLNGPVKELVAYRLHEQSWRIDLMHCTSRSSMEIIANAPAEQHARFINSGYEPGREWHEHWQFKDADNLQAYKRELQAFVTAIEGGPFDECLCSLSEAAHVMQIIDACRISQSVQGDTVMNDAIHKKKYHFAVLSNPNGQCSALCFARPRPINLDVALWTNRPDAVTCPKCLAILQEEAHA